MLASGYHAPRTPAGAPDLEGTWSNASYTQLERPKEFKTLAVPPDEARRFEETLTKNRGVPEFDDKLGQATSEFPEVEGEGLARIGGQIRSSWIVDPADGKLPYRPEAKARIPKPTQTAYDNPEQRPQMDRCLHSTGAAPITSSVDASLFELHQTRDSLAIVAEKNHDLRVIRIVPRGAAPPPRGPPSWMGDSVGHWEGETLVSVTDNLAHELNERDDDFYLSDAARVEERFTRTGANELTYAFTVTDPKMYTQPWKGEMVFRLARGRLYEYACHEGNYAMGFMMQAARDEEKK